MEVAVAIGADPASCYSASAPLPYGIDEFLLAGFIRKQSVPLVKCKTVDLEVIETPGHTPIHISLFGENGEPHLLCGDTVFNAGVGHCHSGDPNVLYATFRDKISKLPDGTRIYPGHDYITNNLQFTLDREPGNADAKALLTDVEGQDPDDALVTTLGTERKVNTFMRLDSAGVIDGVKDRFPDLGDSPSAEDVFLSLRLLRNDW